MRLSEITGLVADSGCMTSSDLGSREELSAILWSSIAGLKWNLPWPLYQGLVIVCIFLSLTISQSEEKSWSQTPDLPSSHCTVYSKVYSLQYSTVQYSTVYSAVASAAVSHVPPSFPCRGYLLPRDVPIVQHPCRCAATGRTEQGGRREPVMNRLQLPISPPFLPARINITLECIMLLHQLWNGTDLGYNCSLLEVVQ